MCEAVRMKGNLKWRLQEGKDVVNMKYLPRDATVHEWN
jgi:hypothetical protein